MLLAALWCAFLASILAQDIEVIGAQPPGPWLAYASLSAAIGVATVLVARAWNLRVRRPLSLAEACVESGLIGLTFGLSQVVLAAALSVTLAQDPVLLVASDTAAIALLGTAVILLGQQRRAEHERRAVLLEEALALEQAKDDAAQIVEGLRIALASDIDVALSPTRASIDQRLTEEGRILSADQWPAIATQLRLAARDTVRPLSRSLWSQMVQVPQRPGLGSVLRNIVTRQPFQPAALILIYLATSLASSVTTLGWLGGVVSLLLGMALIAGVLGGANALMRRIPQRHAAIFITAAVLLQVTGLLTFPIRDAWSSVPYTWAEYVLSVAIGIIVILLTSGFGSLRSHREDMERTFQTDIDRELVASVTASHHVAALARESARILHGSVQTRLISCAVAIERASLTQDAESFRTALEEARSALVAPDLGSEANAHLADEVARKVALWSGLCTVTSDISPDVAETSGPVARDVGRVVEEGLGNAITHGDASVIHVVVRREHGDVVVEMEDDGRGPAGGEPGLGSALLDSVCLSWSLTGLTAGARLTAVVPA